jgi:hypothetical protein
VYVTVLGVATLVTIIGLGALMVVRVEQRAVKVTEAALKADFAAQSGTDLMLFWLSSNPNWRTTYTNDTWTAPQTIDQAALSFKLVDELDGNLANDPTQPVRLYIKAVVGEATRLYSLRLRPRSTTSLLSNGDMEDGLTQWYGSTCTLEWRTDSPHSGTGYIYVTDRTSSASGPLQSIVTQIENGATYTFEMWVKMDSGTRSVMLEIQTTGSTSGAQTFNGGSTSVGSAWFKVTSTITPTWSGTLQGAYLDVVTTSGTTAFRIDDALLVKTSGPSLIPISGTFCREMLP